MAKGKYKIDELISFYVPYVAAYPSHVSQISPPSKDCTCIMLLFSFLAFKTNNGIRLCVGGGGGGGIKIIRTNSLQAKAREQHIKMSKKKREKRGKF